MSFQQFSSIANKELAPGFDCKLVHTQNNTINFLTVKAGSVLPLHQHPHEQSSFVLEGEFEMTVGNDVRLLTPDTFCVIPGDTLHGGRAITDCRLIDVFSPVREDYR
jgi:quercetin dioxygenase-like cupin family protein